MVGLCQVSISASRLLGCCIDADSALFVEMVGSVAGSGVKIRGMNLDDLTNVPGMKKNPRTPILKNPSGQPASERRSIIQAEAQGRRYRGKQRGTQKARLTNRVRRSALEYSKGGTAGGGLKRVGRHFSLGFNSLQGFFRHLYLVLPQFYQ